MKNETKILIQLTRIEDKINTHLLDHKKKFDLFTRVLIPSSAVIATIFSSLVTHWFSSPKH